MPNNRGRWGRLGPGLLFAFGLGIGVVSTTATLIKISGRAPPKWDACNTTLPR